MPFKGRNALAIAMPLTTGSGTTVRSATISFGPNGRYEGQFKVIDSTVAATSQVSVIRVAAPGDGDEDEFDQISLTAVPAAGSVTFYPQAIPGPVYGSYLVTYGVI